MKERKGGRRRRRRQRRRRKNNMIMMDEQIIIRILEFIPNRTDWNSVALCNKYISNISQGILLPPWPTNFKLRVSAADSRSDQRYIFLDRPTWSPDGTQIAGSAGGKIIIFDQRRGLLRFNHHGNINEIGWIAHDHVVYSTDIHLIYSPDGSFLVSATTRLDRTVKIWKYSTDGNYELLREWNAPADWIGRFNTDHHIDISPCSRYIVVIVDRNKILLKDIQNLRETIKSIDIAEHVLHKVLFCKNEGHYSIFIHLSDDETGEESIKIWRPYDDIDDEDDPDTTVSLITILEPPPESGFLALSHDNSMILYWENTNLKLFSYNDVTKSTALKQSIPLACGSNSIYFTPDDKCIVYRNKNGLLVFWNIKTEREITDQMKTTYNVDQYGPIYFSPATAGTIRRFLVTDYTDDCFCIASYWEK